MRSLWLSWATALSLACGLYAKSGSSTDTVTTSFYVADLLFRPRDFPAPQLGLTSAADGSGRTASSIFGFDESEPDAAEFTGETLVELIQDFLDRELPQADHEVRIVGPRLFVTSTQPRSSVSKSSSPTQARALETCLSSRQIELLARARYPSPTRLRSLKLKGLNRAEVEALVGDDPSGRLLKPEPLAKWLEQRGSGRGPTEVDWFLESTELEAAAPGKPGWQITRVQSGKVEIRKPDGTKVARFRLGSGRVVALPLGPKPCREILLVELRPLRR